MAQGIMGFLERYGRYVQRLSLRRRQPNLVLFVHLNGLERTPAAEFLRALQQAIVVPETRDPVRRPPAVGVRGADLHAPTGPDDESRTEDGEVTP